MTIDRAMGLLKMAVPMRAVTMSEFNDFIEAVNMAIYALENLPSAEPEIIHCKDCRKHNVKVGFDEDGHTVWKEDACPLVSWRGKAKGHEFDYQHCSCAELRGEKDEQSDLQTGCD